MKYLAIVAILGISLSLGLFTGCSPSDILGASMGLISSGVDVISNNADLCLIINCPSVGIVDIAGPANPLVPTKPDYDKDPTCTLPGMCGPSIWYPYSIGTSSSS